MSETQELTFAKRLKEQTATIHDSVDNLVMSVEPFTNKENYIKFLKLQSVFHKAVDHIYKDPTNTANRCRMKPATKPSAGCIAPKVPIWARHFCLNTRKSWITTANTVRATSLPIRTDAANIGVPLSNI